MNIKSGFVVNQNRGKRGLFRGNIKSGFVVGFVFIVEVAVNDTVIDV